MAYIIENRSFGSIEKSGNVEVRGVRGCASPFNTEYEIAGSKGSFIEIIKPGAFKKSLSEVSQKRDIKVLWNHNHEKVLGSVYSGTAKVWEDERGLQFEVPDLGNAGYRAEAKEALERGDVSGSSFGFQVIKQNKYSRNGTPVREVLEARLLECSPVSWGANPEAGCEGRCIVDDQQFEEIMKGFEEIRSTDETITGATEAPQEPIEPTPEAVIEPLAIQQAEPEHSDTSEPEENHSKQAGLELRKRKALAKLRLSESNFYTKR